MLEVNNIYKSFGKVEVLKGIDFKLEEGKVISVIGSSGSGKTTLLRCITGLETADVGRITVDGHVTFDWENKVRLTKRQRRENQLATGLVFQSFNLFPQYTVLDNVLLAKKLILKEELRASRATIAEKKEWFAAVTEEAKEIIASVGLGDKLDSYPCQLSGGQQQRVAIARALILSPKVLCFDEPTSALDPEITGEVLKVIGNLAKQGRTMLIVTHEMGFAREVSDEVIFMDRGVIAEQGDPDEMFENPQTERLAHFLNAMLKA
ncbi:MAG: amino acid ABC transporter ATP-binding protein [Clostridia bacterium]|nr:amino acid ABC transporter ATP-binding protein [Clostridia bacterium]